MLVPLQTLGAKPALFVIHGLFGVVAMGRFLAQALGPDQPLYAINANGFDGREPVAGSVKDIVLTYVDEIISAQPTGPLLIAGLCTGVFAAMLVVRELQARGRKVGPLILADPPGIPPGYIKNNQTIDPQDTSVAQLLYDWVRRQLLDIASQSHNQLPFEASDQRRLHIVTIAGVNSLVALSKHVPEIFSGSVAVILSAQRAASFFHPEMYWVKLLSQKPTAYVLPYTHTEIFRSGRDDFARILKFVLEDAMKFRIRVESAAVPAFASA